MFKVNNEIMVKQSNLIFDMHKQKSFFLLLWYQLAI